MPICKDCGAEVERVSKKGYCRDCSKRRMEEAMDQMQKGSGPIHRKWDKGRRAWIAKEMEELKKTRESEVN